MKHLKFIPLIVIVGSLLLTSCAGFSLVPSSSATSTSSSAAAPTTALASPTTAAKAPTITNTSAETAPQVAAPVQSSSEVQALQTAYENIYQQVSPSVVLIQISQNQSAGINLRGQPSQSQLVPVAEGSGFVWSTAGYIVTNNHVIAGADLITVTFADGTTTTAKLVGADPNSDLAVIKVNVPAAQLKPMAIADSNQVAVGQLVVAIGNPFGLANTMTTGIVSAISRSIQVGGTSNNNQSGPAAQAAPSFSIPDIIQTDAAINPGNSGGVLVDMNGALIGVPSQIESSSGSNSGVGFAIPSAIVKQVVPQLISKGTYAHSWIGISGTTLTPDLVTQLGLAAGTQGVLVVTVDSSGPAAKANLVASTVDANGNPSGGDVITAINGQKITRFEDLVSYLFFNTQPGQTVTLSILRNGKTQDVQLTLGTQPAAQ